MVARDPDPDRSKKFTNKGEKTIIAIKIERQRLALIPNEKAAFALRNA